MNTNETKTELVESSGNLPTNEMPVRTVHPSVDIFESEHAYLILADVPGVHSDGLELEIQDGDLLFQGVQVFETVGKALSAPLHPVRFERRFALPRTVDVSKVQARLDNGVLHIELPKRDEVKPRRITVN